MENRIEINEELKSRLRKARSAEEACALLKEEGADAPLAERIWNEISAGREDKQLSLDELEAVSGGDSKKDRDWLKDGCAATVEPNSDCWGTDYCHKWPVTYEHRPVADPCPQCGGPMYYSWTEVESRFVGYYHYLCVNCGSELRKKM